MPADNSFILSRSSGVVLGSLKWQQTHHCITNYFNAGDAKKTATGTEASSIDHSKPA